MRSEKYISAIILSFAFALLMFAMTRKDTPKPVIDKETFIDSIAKLNNQIDSLNSELFVNQTQITRYQVTLELLKEKNKKAAEQFELIHTTQTE